MFTFCSDVQHSCYIKYYDHIIITSSNSMIRVALGQIEVATSMIGPHTGSVAVAMWSDPPLRLWESRVSVFFIVFLSLSLSFFKDEAGLADLSLHHFGKLLPAPALCKQGNNHVYPPTSPRLLLFQLPVLFV